MSFDFDKLKSDGRYRQFYLDFVVKEDVCNLSCDYCLNEHNKLKDNINFERKDGKLNFRLDKLDELVYSDGYKLKDTVDAVLQEYHRTYDSPILKLSGGEILLVKNISQLIKKQAEIYEVVQLLTNGTMVNKAFIEEVKDIRNLHVQLSLDGHTLEMNYNRVKSEEMNAKLLKALDLLALSGLVTEIYCVITKQNIGRLPNFLEYLKHNYGDTVKLFPFPVRQGAGKVMLPGAEELSPLEDIINNYDRYNGILPPKLYMEELYSFIRKHKRSNRCYIPLIASQIFDDGIVTPCPNGWTIQIGNIINSKDEVLNNQKNNRIYSLMSNDPPVAHFCLDCFTEVDILNLYFAGKLTLKDLEASRALYRGDRVKNLLIELKSVFDATDFEDIKKRG